MAKAPIPAPAAAPGVKIVDPRGAWFLSNAVFPLEDPTNAGKGPLTRFDEKSYTQATETNWTAAQHRAGVFTKYDRMPTDPDAKVVPFAEPKAEPKADVPAAVETDKPVEPKKDDETKKVDERPGLKRLG